MNITILNYHQIFDVMHSVGMFMKRSIQVVDCQNSLLLSRGCILHYRATCFRQRIGISRSHIGSMCRQLLFITCFLGHICPIFRVVRIAPLAALLADLRPRFGVYYSAPRSEQQAPPVADVQANLGE